MLCCTCSSWFYLTVVSGIRCCRCFWDYVTGEIELGVRTAWMMIGTANIHCDIHVYARIFMWMPLVSLQDMSSLSEKVISDIWYRAFWLELQLWNASLGRAAWNCSPDWNHSYADHIQLKWTHSGDQLLMSRPVEYFAYSEQGIAEVAEPSVSCYSAVMGCQRTFDLEVLCILAIACICSVNVILHPCCTVIDNVVASLL